jgi:hypothetical protein
MFPLLTIPSYPYEFNDAKKGFILNAADLENKIGEGKKAHEGDEDRRNHSERYGHLFPRLSFSRSRKTQC